MQVQAPLQRVAQRPEPGDHLPVEVQPDGVLLAQHRRMLCHRRPAALVAWLQDVQPVVLVTREEAVGRLRLAPAVSGPGDTRRGPLCQTLANSGRPPVAALVAKVDPPKFPRLPSPYNLQKVSKGSILRWAH